MLSKQIADKRIPAYLEASGKADQEFREMLENGLLSDIETSQYVVRNRCTDSTQMERAASALVGAKGTAICFSPREILRGLGHVTFELIRHELVALALHEHARHFNLPENDHLIFLSIENALDSFDLYKDLLQIKTVQVLKPFKEARRRFSTSIWSPEAFSTLKHEFVCSYSAEQADVVNPANVLMNQSIRETWQGVQSRVEANADLPGVYDWSYSPSALLKNQPTLLHVSQSGDHLVHDVAFSLGNGQGFAVSFRMDSKKHLLGEVYVRPSIADPFFVPSALFGDQAGAIGYLDCAPVL